MSKLSWREFSDQNQKKLEEFPMFFAFNNEQFAEGLKKVGASKDETIVSVGAGGYIKKCDAEALNKLEAEIWQSEREFLRDYGNLVNAITYELANHEFCIEYDPEPTMRVLGIEVDMIEKDETIGKAFREAKKKYLKSVVW